MKLIPASAFKPNVLFVLAIVVSFSGCSSSRTATAYISPRHYERNAVESKGLIVRCGASVWCSAHKRGDGFDFVSLHYH